MKNQPWAAMVKEIEKLGALQGHDDGMTGMACRIRCPASSSMLQVIASWADGWDHVSVSKYKKPPSWREMCWIKDFFFDKHEVVMQLHPAEQNYVNVHPNCLHLWRPHDVEIPLPPKEMV